MKRRIAILALFLLIAAAIPAKAQIPRGEPVEISKVIGHVIDVDERNRYGLFADVEGFQSAAFFKIGVGSYLIRNSWIDPVTGERKTKLLQRSEETIRDIRQAIVRTQLQETGQGMALRKPPLEAGRIVPELLLGGIGAAAGVITPLLFVSGESLEGGNAAVEFVAMGLGSLGCSAGVWLIGSSGKQTGSFPATLLGSAAGMLAGILIGNATDSIIPIFLLVPAGGTIGFNLRRRYETNPGETGALLHFPNRSTTIGYCLMALPSRDSRSSAQATLGLSLQVQF